MLDFLARHSDAIQAAAALISVATLVPAAIFFVFNQSTQRLERKEAKYGELDAEYRAFLELALANPRLGLYQFGPGPKPARLSDLERLQRDVGFDLLTDLFERAYVLHRKARSSFHREQWEGWVNFIDVYLNREDYLDFWRRVMGGDNWETALTRGVTQYDLGFEAFMFERIRAVRAMQLSR